MNTTDTQISENTLHAGFPPAPPEAHQRADENAVVVERIDVEVVDESAAFFAPMDYDVIGQLLGAYESEREKVERISELLTGTEYAGAVSYFLSNVEDRRTTLEVAEVFAVSGAVAVMNRFYWKQVVALTDVYSTMPQARRSMWDAQLRGDKFMGGDYRGKAIEPLPDFVESTVRSTLASLLAQRGLFFAERIDGIFRNLSGDHVTNQPQGFSTRMIVGYMLNYGSIRSERAGLIHDLRSVVAKIMGRDAPSHSSGFILLQSMYELTGAWVSIDGGAIRIRVYKKGTAHIEIHPDIAYRLNQVLATLHPMAIPAQFRTKPAKRAKEFQMLGRPLPFATLDLLTVGEEGRRPAHDPNTFAFENSAKKQKATFEDACNVLTSLGGTEVGSDAYHSRWVFAFPISSVLREVIVSGCLPDQKAHQFYPTQEKLARIVVAMAGIEDGDLCCEPSAGQGGIADHMPKGRTTCVEISNLHCAVLRAKRFKVVEADFVQWGQLDTNAAAFDVVVMNPPFSEGRAKAHVEAAARLIRVGGRLVAILPASMQRKPLLGAGWVEAWSEIYPGEFVGTSVAVTVLRAEQVA